MANNGFTSRHLIAVDIGDQGIHAAQVMKAREGLCVRGLMHLETENPEAGGPKYDKALVSALRHIARDGRFSGKRAVISLPNRDIFVFPVRFEQRPGQAPEAAILDEARKLLPFSPEEGLIDYPSIRSPSPDSPLTREAIIVAARRDCVDRYLTAADRAGLTPEVIEFGVSALIRLHSHLHRMDENPAILCNVDHVQTVITAVTQDGILAVDTIAWGIDAMIEGIAANLDLPGRAADAGLLLRRYGLTSESPTGERKDEDNAENISTDDVSRAVYQIVTPYVEELIYELHRVTGYVTSATRNADFSGVYMYGQAPLIPHLDQYVQGQVGIPTKLVNPVERIPLSRDSILANSVDGSPFALALGLAMRKVPWL